MKAGLWEKSRFNGKELYEQVLGVIGLGNIGSIVADRALGLRMRVIAFDPLVTQERAQQLRVELVSFEELLARSDAITTAEHAVCLLTSLARSIPQATASMKAGLWEKSRFNGKELYEQVLGVIGLGNIGSIVADRALGLRMRVIAFDPLVTQERAQQLRVELVSFEELLERADAITIHVPRTKETEGLISAPQFARMKDGVLLVNAARGGIVDEAALLAAIESGKVAGAALDVFETEPVPPDHPLLKRDEVIATPHLGAATAQAQLNVAIAVAEQVRDYLKTSAVRNAVNLPSLSAHELAELSPYLTLAEKLGLFAGQICRGIQQIEVEYSGQIAGESVKPITLTVAGFPQRVNVPA